jgi:hypothetical protein
MAASSAGKQFKFRILATFGSTGTSTITNAITKIGSVTIDEKSNLVSVTRGTTWTKAGTPLVGIAPHHTTGVTPELVAGQNGADANAHSFQVSQTLAIITGSQSVLTVRLPLTKTNPGADG